MTEQIEQLTDEQREYLESRSGYDSACATALRIIDAQAAALAARDQRVAELELTEAYLRRDRDIQVGNARADRAVAESEVARLRDALAAAEQRADVAEAHERELRSLQLEHEARVAELEAEVECAQQSEDQMRAQLAAAKTAAPTDHDRMPYARFKVGVDGLARAQSLPEESTDHDSAVPPRTLGARKPDDEAPTRAEEMWSPVCYCLKSEESDCPTRVAGLCPRARESTCPVCDDPLDADHPAGPCVPCHEQPAAPTDHDRAVLEACSSLGPMKEWAERVWTAEKARREAKR